MAISYILPSSEESDKGDQENIEFFMMANINRLKIKQDAIPDLKARPIVS